MSKNTPEGLRDFPASKVFADLIDKGPGRAVPKKPAPVDEQAMPPILDSLHRLTGFTPPTKSETLPPEPVKIFHGEGSAPPPAPVEQADFLHLVPPSKGRQPKKIAPAWHSDPERIMEIGSDVRKRTRAQGSDAGHDATVRRQEHRKQLHLPPVAPPWKELQRDFMALTEEDKDVLRLIGYKPERVKNLHSLTVECMLRDLQRYRSAQQK
jgi:hypothetical protein